MLETDSSLITEFNARSSEAAFAALVRQHVNLVFATAMRQVGDAGAAEEITQNVFIALARSARKLNSHPTIAGWLHQTTLNKSREWLRGELRRRKREQVAVKLETAREEGDSVWLPLVPLLDEALLQLREPDRQAVILHFLEGQTFQEVGSALGVGEDAARKRVSRCLDQLTGFFRRRNFAIPTLTAGVPLFALSSHAAPNGLAASATSAGLAARSTISTVTLVKGVLKIMAWTKTKTAIIVGAGVLFVAVTATVTLREIADNKAEALWRISAPNPDRAPMMVEILPTKFPADVHILNVGHRGDNWVGVGQPALQIARVAYAWRPGRIIFPAGEPGDRYDFISTLPKDSGTVLQAKLKKKLGYVGHHETRNTDVLALKVARPNAPGLRPPVSGSRDYINQGHYHCDNAPITSDTGWYPGISRFLENEFGVPVIDQTGLAQNFCIDLTWGEHFDSDPGHNTLKQALLEQLGLELVPTNMPVEMLVVEKAK